MLFARTSLLVGNYGEVGAPGGTVRVFESREVRVRGTARATSYVHVLSAGTGIVDLPTHRTHVSSLLANLQRRSIRATGQLLAST